MTLHGIQTSLERVEGLLSSLPQSGSRFSETVRQLSCIQKLLFGLETLVKAYGDIFACNQPFSASLNSYEHHVLKRSAKKGRHGSIRNLMNPHESLKGVRAQVFREAWEIQIFIVQFALRCHEKLRTHPVPLSATQDLFDRLRHLKSTIEGKRSHFFLGSGTLDLAREGESIRDLWDQLCRETGLLWEGQPPALPAEEILDAPSPYWTRSFVDATSLPICHPVSVSSPVWNWPPRRSSTGGPIASIIINEREYLLDEYERPAQKPDTIVWSGDDGQTTVEHKLTDGSFPYSKHSRYHKNLRVTFPGLHDLRVKRRGRVKYNEVTQVEYSFTDARFATQFHEDLRGRELVYSADVRQIASVKSQEAATERIYLWKDRRKEGIQLHTLSFYANQFERRELQFPVLWYDRSIKKESRTCLRLQFLFNSTEGDFQGPTPIRRSSSISVFPRPPSVGSSVSSSSYMPPSGSSMFVPETDRTFLSLLQSLKISFETESDTKRFLKSFGEALDQDLSAYLVQYLPLPAPPSSYMSRSPTQASQQSSYSSFRLTTATSSETIATTAMTEITIEGPGGYRKVL